MLRCIVSPTNDPARHAAGGGTDSEHGKTCRATRRFGSSRNEHVMARGMDNRRRVARTPWRSVSVALAVFAMLQGHGLAQRILTSRQAIETERLKLASIREEGRGLGGLQRRERQIVALCVASRREADQAEKAAASRRDQPQLVCRLSKPEPLSLVAERFLASERTGTAPKQSVTSVTGPGAGLQSTAGDGTTPGSWPLIQSTTRHRPTAEPVPGKRGIVVSPFAPEEGYVDVRGLLSGTEVRDPYTGRIFIVP
ncbi:MAG: hypothetical protein WCP06_02820 [Verrucomicrobiota bacterium]